MCSSFNNKRTSIFMSMIIILGFIIFDLYSAIGLLFIISALLIKDAVYKVGINDNKLVISKILNKQYSLKWTEIKFIKVIIENSYINRKLKSNYTYFMNYRIEITDTNDKQSSFFIGGLDYPDNCSNYLKEIAIKNHIPVQEEFIY